MADGSVKIDVGLNIGKAEKDLAKLRDKINKTEDALNANAGRKTELEKQIAEVGAQADEATRKVKELKDQLSQTRSRDEKASIRAQLADATEEQRILTRESNRLNDEYVRVNQKIEQGTQNLGEMQEEAGQLTQQIERARPGEAIASSLENARKSLLRFVKYAFGIRTIYILFQRLKSAIKDAVKEYAEYDEELKLTLKTMEATKKAIRVTNGAALAGIYQAILPIVQKIANWMLEAANAASRFIAIVSGKSSYKRAVVNTDEVAASLEDVSEQEDEAADKAQELKRQLMGFDEINILSDNKDTGSSKTGKGKTDPTALDGIELVEEAIDGFDGSFLDNLALTVKDVLFDWSDLSPEQIAEKVIAGLGAVLGAALGIALGMGPGGVLLMTLGGLVLGLIADSLIFDHDGQLNGEEIMTMILMALGALAGGILGFKLIHGAKGAMIGVWLGAALGLVASQLLFDHDGRVSGMEIYSMIIPILNAMVGAAAGFVFTKSPYGAAIGAAAGFALTLLLQSLEAKASGNFSGLAAGILAVINSVLLGAVGFTLTGGNIIGGLVGVIAGIGLTLVIEQVKATITAKDIFNSSELGKQIQDIRDRVQETMKADADIRMHIKSITGEVDSQTMADLTAAQKLIDEIFDLDAKKDKTTTEAKLLVELVNQLNGMNLDGITLTFDETTGAIQQTRGEVNSLMEDLLRQYQMKAVADAYTESFKAQFEATANLKVAERERTEALEKLAEAQTEAEKATSEYNKALDEYNNLTNGFVTYDREAVAAAKERRDATREASQAAEEGVKTAKKASEEAQAAYESALETTDKAKEKVVEIGEAFKQTIAESSDTTETIVQNAGRTSEAYSQSAERIRNDSGTVNDAFQSNIDASATAADQVTQNTQQMGEGVTGAYKDVKTDADSTFGELKDTVTGKTEEITAESTADTQNLYTDVTGKYKDIHDSAVQNFSDISRNVPIIMDGMAQNVQTSAQTMEQTFSTMQYTISAALDTIRANIESAIYSIQSIDWSIPAPHIPHISWTYDTVYSDDGSSFNIPQFFVDWYARGGVFDFPQLIGVGEDGAEAVVPLEKNTGWMQKMADGLMERFERADFANRLAEAFMSTPRPAMAGGGIVPPRAIGNSSMFTDSDIDRIVRGLSGLFGNGGRQEIINKVYLDGKQISDSVSKWQRIEERSRG